MNFETVIGLEVHVELNTNSKIFSPTSAHFGKTSQSRLYWLVRSMFVK